MGDGGITTTALRYVEVCAGAGGMGLGLHRAGWSGTGLELDADAVATHNANVGPCLAADITTAHAPHGADLVAGGVPCQSFSNAGKGEGLADPRGQLFASLLRIGAEAGARCILLENVRGLVSCGALPVILAAFRAAAYEPVHALLCAADYGVPQNRVRLFIAGFRDAADLARFRWPAPSHGAPGNLYGLPAWRTVRQALDLGTGGAADVLDVPSHTVSAGGTAAGGAEPFANAGYRKRLAAAMATAGLLDRPATAITSRNAVAAAGHHASNWTGSVRAGVAECSALQSFPAGFAFSGTTTSQHKQAGNAVPPLLAEALGGAVRRALYGEGGAA